MPHPAPANDPLPSPSRPEHAAAALRLHASQVGS